MLSGLLHGKSKPEKSGLGVKPRNKTFEDAYFNQTPKKVIKANCSWFASMPGELSFKVNDYFYVIKDDGSEYYEVINPIERVKGLVPTRCFDNLNKSSSVNNLHDHSISDPFGVMDSLDRSGKCNSSFELSDCSDNYVHHSTAGPNLVLGDAFAPILPPKDKSTLLPIGNELNDSKTSLCDTKIDRIVVKTDPRVVNGFVVEGCRGTDKLTCYKTYNDFWDLHNSVIGKYPELAGYTPGVPRVIAFFPPPITSSRKGSVESTTTKATQKEEKRRNRLLMAYLESLSENNIKLDRFFHKAKKSNIEFDPMDLLENYEDISSEPIRFKLHTPNDTFLFELPKVDYHHLRDAVFTRSGSRHIWYRDEVGREINLCNDTDLNVLISGRWTKVVIFVRFI